MRIFLRALSIGLVVGALVALRAEQDSVRKRCWQGLRLVRSLIAAYEEEEGRLPRSPYDAVPLWAAPVNPYTGSRRFVLVPPGADAVEFAARSREGWAYLPAEGRDAKGWLPPGLVLPCGAPERLGFEIEDRIPWRR